MSQDTSASASFMDWAPRPQYGEVTIESREVAEAALAAGMVELLGSAALEHANPTEAVMELDLAFPGFRDWLGWDLNEIAETAWSMARSIITPASESAFHEVTKQTN